MAYTHPVNIKLLIDYILPSCQDYIQETLTYSRGNVTVRYPAGSYNLDADAGLLHRVLWFHTNEHFLLLYRGVPGSEKELGTDESSQLFRKMFENVTDYSIRDYASSLGGHTAKTQPFSTTLSGVPIKDTISYWYCLETSRHLCLLHYRAEGTLGKRFPYYGYRSHRDNTTCYQERI